MTIRADRGALPSSASLTEHRVAIAVAIAIGAGYVLLSTATLTLFPLVWMDEPWYTQSAASYATNGSFALPMFADLAGFDRENVVYGRAYLLAIAASFEALGINPFAARIPSLIGGLVAIAATFGIARELWGDRAAVIAAILLATAPAFLMQSHDARPEVMLVAAWTSALYLGLNGSRTGSALRSGLAGLVATIGADLHLNGGIVPVALFLVLILQRADRRALAAYVGGVVLGGLWWLWVHVLPDPALFLDQVRLFSQGWPILQLLEQPVFVIGMELSRYVLVEPRLSVVLAIVAVGAAIAILRRRRDQGVVALLAFAAVVFTYLALFSGAKSPIYAIVLWPVAALVVARWLDLTTRITRWAVVGVLVVTSAFAVGSMVIRDGSADYDSYVGRLREVIPAGATVQGQPTAWFGFTDHPFIASQYFIWREPYADEVRRLGIDYILADQFFLETQLHRVGEVDAGQVETFLAEHAEVVDVIEDDHFGGPFGGTPPFRTVVYRVLPE